MNNIHKFTCLVFQFILHILSTLVSANPKASDWFGTGLVPSTRRFGTAQVTFYKTERHKTI